jgi:hypothetical protein
MSDSKEFLAKKALCGLFKDKEEWRRPERHKIYMACGRRKRKWTALCAETLVCMAVGDMWRKVFGIVCGIEGEKSTILFYVYLTNLNCGRN